MSRIVFTLALFSVYLMLSGQQISVESFRLLENDLDARVNFPEKDRNGEVAALIKVVTTQTGFEFDSDMLGIVDIVPKTAEYWVYVPRGARSLTIKHSQLGILRNYPYPLPIESATVYEMKLVTGEVTVVVTGPEIQMQWLVVTSNPEGADFYLDESFKGITPLSLEEPLGKHTYRLELSLYHSEAGILNLSEKDGRKEIHGVLKPKFGSLTLNSGPEQGAEVQLDGNPTGKKTPCVIEKIPSGEHTITLRKEWYEPKSEKVTIMDGQTSTSVVNMNAVFGTVTINAAEDADIYINDEFKSSGKWEGRIIAGWINIEARKEKYNSDKQRAEVTAGQPLTVTLNPQPRLGTLKITSTPFDASIALNGKDYGKTPATIRALLIGDYTLQLSKPLHAAQSFTVTIKENEVTEINRELASGRTVTISSEPSGATLILNGKAEGATPKSVSVAFGENRVKLTKNGYVDFEERFNVTESQEKYLFKMKPDRVAQLELDVKKYKKRKIIWLSGAVLSAGAGVYYYLSAESNYKEYQTANDDATDLHNTIETQDKIWPAAFGLAGVCGVMTIINASRQKKIRSQINLSAIPVDGGAMINIRYALK
ncbi:MAG: PEGA domain-containing protein [Bacteroidales bacterium]|nr:PEGA domain-containing protein [Bacteroidales bacterium]